MFVLALAPCQSADKHVIDIHGFPITIKMAYSCVVCNYMYMHVHVIDIHGFTITCTKILLLYVFAYVIDIHGFAITKSLLLCDYMYMYMYFRLPNTRYNGIGKFFTKSICRESTV